MDEHPPLTIRDYVPGHRFEAAVGGRTAVLTYQVRTDGSMLFVHTVVPQMLRGRGIGKKLVEFALHTARERGLKVVPQCSMVADYMSKHPETHDLLAPDTAGMLDL